MAVDACLILSVKMSSCRGGQGSFKRYIGKGMSACAETRKDPPAEITYLYNY